MPEQTNLITFLRQLGAERRRQIKPARLTERVGFRGNAAFPDGERLLRWLTHPDNSGLIDHRIDSRVGSIQESDLS